MAKIETLTRNGMQERCVNIEAPVGPVGVKRVKNLPGDVMLIQASIYMLAKFINPKYVVGSYDTDLAPPATGQYDSKTENAILLCQKARRSELLNTDGVIDPASYHGRNIVSSRLMTITLLHADLRDTFGGVDGDSYPEELVRRVPQLAGWLK